MRRSPAIALALLAFVLTAGVPVALAGPESGSGSAKAKPKSKKNAGAKCQAQAKKPAKRRRTARGQAKRTPQQRRRASRRNRLRAARRVPCLANSGAGVIRADFNGDGFTDEAAGVPLEDLGASNGLVDAGAVNVFYGLADGLPGISEQFLTQPLNGRGVNLAESGDQFGSALAAGDFDGDGFTDLAVGVPFEDLDASQDAGAVQIYRGSATGVAASSLITQDSSLSGGDVLDQSESHDAFGSSLAWGDFNGDAKGDLAAGAPGENLTVFNRPGAGAVNVLYGSGNGLIGTGNQFLTQEALSDAPEIGDHFGAALTTGRFDTGGHEDLVIGVPDEDFGSRDSPGGIKLDAGAAHELYGSPSGLVSANIKFWNQDTTESVTFSTPTFPGQAPTEITRTAEVSDAAESGDQFGAALTNGDFDGNGVRDVAVGVPGEDLAGIADAGAVNVLYGNSDGGTRVAEIEGSPSGPRPIATNQFWSQDSEGISDTAEAGDRFGTALAANNLNNDSNGLVSIADLVVGVPLEDLGSGADAKADAGLVHLVLGSPGEINPFLGPPGRLTAHNSSTLNQGPKAEGREAGDRFGAAVAAWRFNADMLADLAIGVPGEEIGPILDRGQVDVRYLSVTKTGTLSASAATILRQGASSGGVEQGDQFGSDLY